MKTTIVALSLLLVAGTAQAAEQHGMDHGQMHQDVMQHNIAGHGVMDHGMAYGHDAEADAGTPLQPGQSAFAAIQEIVGILEADPETDWSEVDIARLRRHLIDMDNVTMRARVTGEAAPGGMRYTVSGEGAVADSIRRMALAHAATMDGAGGWHFTATATETGAVMTVTSEKPEDEAKIRALGFIGALTRGAHHQVHHLMIARGAAPHE